MSTYERRALRREPEEPETPARDGPPERTIQATSERRALDGSRKNQKHRHESGRISSPPAQAEEDKTGRPKREDQTSPNERRLLRPEPEEPQTPAWDDSRGRRRQATCERGSPDTRNRTTRKWRCHTSGTRSRTSRSRRGHAKGTQNRTQGNRTAETRPSHITEAGVRTTWNVRHHDKSTGSRTPASRKHHAGRTGSQTPEVRRHHGT